MPSHRARNPALDTTRQCLASRGWLVPVAAAASGCRPRSGVRACCVSGASHLGTLVCDSVLEFRRHPRGRGHVKLALKGLLPLTMKGRTWKDPGGVRNPLNRKTRLQMCSVNSLVHGGLGDEISTAPGTLLALEVAGFPGCCSSWQPGCGVRGNLLPGWPPRGPGGGGREPCLPVVRTCGLDQAWACPWGRNRERALRHPRGFGLGFRTAVSSHRAWPPPT